jgi:glutathione S-transferase
LADYLEVDQARQRGGLRLVVSAGVPGPWGEAAKALFQVKKIPFVLVRQEPGGTNEALAAWTGETNAPQAIYENEPARCAWTQVLFLAERLAPDPALIPADPALRARMLGLIHEIAGEQGLAWTQRVVLLSRTMARLPDPVPDALEGIVRMAERYGCTEESAARANERLVDILGLLDGVLERQVAAGSRYFIADRLSALDIYWSTFSNMLEPLPHDQNPMSDLMRKQYTMRPGPARDALSPRLLEHRDFVFREHLTLPLDF